MIKSDHPNILIAAAEVISCLCTLAGNSSSRHSLKVTIHLIAIWKKWCQHDFMKNHETAQILSQSLSLAGKLNWPNYNALLILIELLLLFMHKFIALQPNYNNVTWTNNFKSILNVHAVMTNRSKEFMHCRTKQLSFFSLLWQFFQGPNHLLWI